jgi:hypothetical protein
VTQILLLAAPVGQPQSGAALWLDTQLTKKIGGDQGKGAGIDEGVDGDPLPCGANERDRVEKGAHEVIIPRAREAWLVVAFGLPRLRRELLDEHRPLGHERHVDRMDIEQERIKGMGADVDGIALVVEQDEDWTRSPIDLCLDFAEVPSCGTAVRELHRHL